MSTSPQYSDPTARDRPAPEAERPTMKAEQNAPTAQRLDPVEAALLELRFRHVRKSSYLHAPADHLRVR